MSTTMARFEEWLSETYPRIPPLVKNSLTALVVYGINVLEESSKSSEAQRLEYEALIQAQRADLKELREERERHNMANQSLTDSLERAKSSLTFVRSQRDRLNIEIAALREDMGEYTDESCTKCHGNGKVVCTVGCTHPTTQHCVCRCHAPCQACGGAGRKWLPWKEQYNRLLSLTRQRQRNSGHEPHCPRSYGENVSCVCALPAEESVE